MSSTTPTSTISNGVLYIDGVAIKTRCKCKKLVVADGLIVVLYEASVDEIFNQNVSCFGQHGTRLWDVAERPRSSHLNNPFLSLWTDESGKICAGTWDGIEYIVSLDDGSLSPIRLRRF